MLSSSNKLSCSSTFWLLAASAILLSTPIFFIPLPRYCVSPPCPEVVDLESSHTLPFITLSKVPSLSVSSGSSGSGLSESPSFNILNVTPVL